MAALRTRRRGRLYLHIYLAFIGIIVALVAVTALTFALFDNDADDLHKARAASVVIARLLPPETAPRSALERSLEYWRAQLDVDLAVTSADGELLAAAGAPVRRPRRRADDNGWVSFRHGKLTAGVRLPDGRWAMIGHQRESGRAWPLALGVLAVVLGIGVYPLARRITRRLERLRASVDELGAGEFGARVDVEGNDEVAELARSFNRAAERIEALVNTQNAMLAGASHELRSPLTRIRMAIELLAGDDRPALREGVSKDIRELDELIDELLAASRFQAAARGRHVRGPGNLEAVDVLALAAEEGVRVGAEVAGVSSPYIGEARWLSRLIRNLLENARRHSGGENIRIDVRPLARGVRMTVEDDGDGVPPALQERIFEPFYRPAGIREGHDRGVGLGLALVRQIAERHGGSATCEARAGGGTRFVVLLKPLDSGADTV